MRALVANPFNATGKKHFDISRQTKDGRSHVVLPTDSSHKNRLNVLINSELSR
jgi:hypothetical protein